MDDKQRERLERMTKDFEDRPYPKEFMDFNWVRVANYLGGSTIAEGTDPPAGRIRIKHHRFGLVGIHDNGGEVNLTAERPVLTDEQKAVVSQLGTLEPASYYVRHRDVASVPYTSNEAYLTNVTMAYRIRMFLEQKPIDWDWNEDDPETIHPYRDPTTQLGPE